MIKLSLVKKFGIELVSGDMVTSSDKSGSAAMISRTASTYFNGVGTEDYRRVESFAPRLISDGIPTSIDGDVLLEITNGNGLVLYISARNVAWHAWKTWRPSMEWLVQQASDKPVKYKDDTQNFGEDVQVSANPKVEFIHKAWADLNGDISSTQLYDSKSDLYLHFHDKEGYVCYHSLKMTNSTLICTIKEFNNYCEKMKAFIGGAPKVPSNKIKVTLNDADDISKGFTPRCVVIPVSIEPFQDGYSMGYRTEFTEPTKPIFTQSMADAGELPPVGSECLMSMIIDGETSWMGCYVVGKTKDQRCLVVHDQSDELHFAFIDNGSIIFKPLDVRTRKQKAVDAAFLAFNADKDTLGSIYDYWMGGDFKK